ncbi:MAG TPA: septal ring lytic transglycosylase RlpA family protein [Chloroflexota bacterium]|nr:septal ring lytic transglycosylase RlpA family protein [Chloroflexota bacterium]
MARILIALAITVSVTLTLLPANALANGGADFDVPAGHFFSQTNGTNRGADGGGFVIADTGGIPFWTFFQQEGGVATLGYPISQRFVWDGFTCQATQRGILQWNATARTVQLANIFDYFAQTGKDPWLESARLAPRAQQAAEETNGQSFSFVMLAHFRFRWLYSDPAIFHRYFSTPDYYTVYGLPTSPVVDLGAYSAVRFQRAVIYHWKTKMPWTDDGQTSVGLSGDLFREVGGIPTDALRPTPAGAPLASLPVAPAGPALIAAAPPPVRHTVEIQASASQPSPAAPARLPGPSSVTGVATWYGSDFQGRHMADGEIYDMYNPEFAASNIYPLGTRLRVTRLVTGQSIIVRVTDHGAFRYPNVLDLSYAAFSRLADPSSGVIGVRVEPVG